MAFSISISITQNSQNIAKNTSNVTVKVNASWTYGTWSCENMSKWVKINGTTYYFSDTDLNPNQTTSGSATLYTKTLDIAHASDGTKKLDVSASVATTTSSGTQTASASKTLTTIPRKSSISSVTASALGSASTIKVTQQSTSFTHTITYKCGTATGTVCTKSSSTSISWTPPTSLASQNTTGTSLTVTFTIETFNGSTSLGTNTWVSYAYTIPNNDTFKPTVSLSVADVYSYRTTYGAYVQGKSKLDIGITATGKNGATVKSYTTTIDGKTYSTNSITTPALSGSGTLTIKTTIKDSRGFTNSTTWDVDVLAYAAPKFTSATVTRTDANGNASASGAYLTVNFGSEITSLNSKNSAAYTVKYKKTSENTYSSATTLTSYTGNFAVSGGKYTFAADTGSSYDVMLTAIDAFSSIEKQLSGASISKFMSWLGNRGVAFGKVAELLDRFEVAWIAYFRNHLGVGNKTGVTDGKTGVFLHKDGTITLQRASTSTGYGPFIGFFNDTDTTYAAVLQTDINGYLRFSYADKYRFGSDLIMPNDFFLYGEDSDGTERNLFGINGNNNLLIGWDLYDKALGNTIIYGNDVAILPKTSGLTTAQRPYYRVGDTISYVDLYTSGFVTSDKTSVRFTVPISKPVIGSPTITASSVNGFIIRQNNSYKYGSSASAYKTPSTYACELRGSTLVITATFPADSTVTNNETIAIAWHGRITFS